MIITPLFLGGSVTALIFCMLWWVWFPDAVWKLMCYNWGVSVESTKRKIIITLGIWFIHFLALNWVIFVLRLMFIPSGVN